MESLFRDNIVWHDKFIPDYVPDQNRWIFSVEDFQNTPSMRCGLSSKEESRQRNKASQLIRQICIHLNLSAFCISSAVTYMHRFYMMHPMTVFPWDEIAVTALFVATKCLECTRSARTLVYTSNSFRSRRVPIDGREFNSQVAQLIFNEDVMLQTFNFDLHINDVCSYIRLACLCLKGIPKAVARLAISIYSDIVCVSSVSVRFRASVLACACLSLAGATLNHALPVRSHRVSWYSFIDKYIDIQEIVECEEDINSIRECLKRHEGRNPEIYVIEKRKNSGKKYKRPNEGGILRSLLENRISYNRNALQDKTNVKPPSKQTKRKLDLNGDDDGGPRTKKGAPNYSEVSQDKCNVMNDLYVQDFDDNMEFRTVDIDRMFNNIELAFEEASGFMKKTKVNQENINQEHQGSVLDLNSNVDNLERDKSHYKKSTKTRAKSHKRK
ncbi:cyclin-T2 isoform X2 [Aethina tumida]|uniref:cyclin-T2 isoform X2 n=1 Tax=Aethina tumida TaxID=116153 RepID=UPI0021498FDB|nr:cyclin-T2 isoform X2 [Aethina tumida]